MSQASNEPNNSQGHPAWKELLDVIPDALHPLVTPKLEEWDKRQQDKLQEVHGQYEPYKKFVENKVPAQAIEQSLYIANHLQSNPSDFIQRAIENFDVDISTLIPQQAPQNNQQPDELEEEWDGVDISKHPMFQQVLSQLETLQTTQQTWQQQQQQQQQEQQLEEYLTQLETEHGKFDRLYVASMLANNIDGPQAVKQYQDMVHQQALELVGGDPEKLKQFQQQNQRPDHQEALNVGEDAPVVMGANGTAGTGTPNQQVSMGSLSAGDTMNIVEQMLINAAKEDS